MAPEWIEEALTATGTATLRRRQQLPWLVIGMALFRDRSSPDVVNKLDLVTPGIVVNAAANTGENVALAWPPTSTTPHRRR